MVFNLKINNVSINEFIIDTIKAPFIETNRNYELIAPIMSFTISYAYSQSLNLEDIVELSSDATIIFYGYISEIKNDYNTKKFKVQSTSYLIKLKDYIVQDAQPLGVYLRSFVPDGASTTQYNTQSVSVNSIPITLKNVQLIWLLKRLFNVCFFELDTSEISSVLLRTINSKQYYLSDLYVDLEMFLAINSEWWGEIPTKANFWDVISKVAGCFKLYFVSLGNINTKPTWKVYSAINTGEMFTSSDIPNNVRYAYEITNKEARDKGGVGFEMSFTYTVLTDETDTLCIPASYYASGADFPIIIKDTIKLNDEEVKNVIQWYNHLLFLLRDKDNATPGQILLDKSDYFLFSYGFNDSSFGLLDNFIDSLKKDYTQEEIETDLFLYRRGVRESTVILSNNKRITQIRQEEMIG